MFRKIWTLITFPVVMRRAWKHATPEQKAVLLSKTASDEEKGMIADRIVREVYPNDRA